MVYGVLRLINFAHGDVYMLGAFAGYFLANALNMDANPSVLGAIAVTLGAMAVCAVIGILIERLAYRPVRHHARLTSLITAIGVSLLLEYGGQVVFGATPRFFPQMIRSQTYAVGGVQITNQNLLIIFVALIVMFGLQFIVHQTKIGKAMRAVSFNLSVAKLMGINTDFVIAFTFALGSALAAAGGVMVALAIPRIDPLMGLMTGLKAFVAAVLGGIGDFQINPYYARIINLIGINITLAVSLNLINGLAGQFSIGHAGFMAVGGYTATYLTVYHGRQIAALAGSTVSDPVGSSLVMV